MTALNRFVSVVIVFFVPGAVWAITCPYLEPQGDWDRDGIANESDACCFLATLPDRNLPEVCPLPEAGDPRDMNMNGETDLLEPECCIVPTGGCHAAETDGCEDGEYAISCDRLLFYDGITSHVTADESCGESCICFSVDDFDGDFDDRTGLDPIGGVDNCPWVPNPNDALDGTQPNADGDIFGDACDTCLDDTATPEPCTMGDPNSETACPEETPCLPFVTVSSDWVSVAYYCAPGEEADEDEDGVGDSCDNCPSIPNPNQADTDRDGYGNMCDDCDNDPDKYLPGECGCGIPDTDRDNDGTPNCHDACPDDYDKVAPGICGCGRPDSNQDRDNDGVVDCIDNCPDTPNTSQADRNQNGIGDACDDKDTDIGNDTAGMDTESGSEGRDTDNGKDTDKGEDSDRFDTADSDSWDFFDGGDAADGADDSGFDTETETVTDTDGDDTEHKDSETVDTDIVDTEPKDTQPDTEVKDTESETGDSEPNDTGNGDTPDSTDDSETTPDIEGPADDDSDGIPNNEDNCPYTANPDQNDDICTEDIYKGGALSCDCSTSPGRPSPVGGFLLGLLLMLVISARKQ